MSTTVKTKRINTCPCWKSPERLHPEYTCFAKNQRELNFDTTPKLLPLLICHVLRLKSKKQKLSAFSIQQLLNLPWLSISAVCLLNTDAVFILPPDIKAVESKVCNTKTIPHYTMTQHHPFAY